MRVDPDKIEASADWHAIDPFDGRERAALANSEAVARPDAKLNDGTMADLRRSFDDDAIVELTGLVAFLTMSSRFNSALAVPPRGFCQVRGTVSMRDLNTYPTRGDPHHPRTSKGPKT